MSTDLVALITNGGFAAAFVWLLIDTRREAKHREDKLMTALASLTRTYERMAATLDSRLTQHDE